jgi:hypothetical protein
VLSFRSYYQLRRISLVADHPRSPTRIVMSTQSRDSNIAPFDLPFEHPSGVQLNFNFWTRRTYLETEKDVCDLITALLVGDDPECMKSATRPPVKIVLAVIQGLDSTGITSENVSTSLFFSQCSSVPTNLQQRSEIASKISRAQPTDTIYNTLLWPEKPPCSLETLKIFHSKKLFENFVLKFQVGISFFSKSSIKYFSHHSPSIQI